MKNLIFLLFAVLMFMPLSRAVQAAGAPPKNVMKGVFSKVESTTGKAFFQAGDNSEIKVLRLGEGMTVEDVPLDRKVLVSLNTNAGPNVIKDVSIMFMDMTLTRIFSLLVIGLIGGLLSGFIGSGGAFVMTPAMMTLGAPGIVAVASNMCHKFPKAMVGSYKRWKYGQADIKLGVVIAISAIAGVEIGIKIQKFILDQWGNAGSNLYVSTIFVVVLIVVGGYVALDAYKLTRGGSEVTTSKLAVALQKINLWPMMEFKVANLRISAWVTIPIGLLTGMLAATIAVGGFIGVPGMIYVIGASALVSSATELIVAFIMGFYGSVQWGLSGLIDIRMTLLILAGSLFGVQLGALGTTYVKDYMIKIVMASVMLIVAVSRGAKIPGYLADLELIPELETKLAFGLNTLSFWALITALAVAGVIISVAMIRGMIQARKEDKGEAAQEPV
jgi:uncharacterized protein